MRARGWRSDRPEPAENVGRLLSVNHKGAAWSGPERRPGERSRIPQMNGQIFAVFVLRDLYQTARIDTHFMGRSGLPEGPNRTCGAALAPRTCALGPTSRAAPRLSGRPLRPTGGRALRPAWLRREGLVVPHTTTPSAPCERTGERGEMGVYPRSLVLAASRSAQAPRTEVTAR